MLSHAITVSEYHRISSGYQFAIAGISFFAIGC
jgi:hypothetical protein